MLVRLRRAMRQFLDDLAAGAIRRDGDARWQGWSRHPRGGGSP
jgi:hypothetical protein